MQMQAEVLRSVVSPERVPACEQPSGVSCAGTRLLRRTFGAHIPPGARLVLSCPSCGGPLTAGTCAIATAGLHSSRRAMARGTAPLPAEAAAWHIGAVAPESAAYGLPNPAIKRTCLRQAAYGERWAYPNSGRSQRMKTNPPKDLRAELAATVGLGCPSVGGQQTLGASATGTAAHYLSLRPVSCGIAPLRATSTVRSACSVAQGPRSAVGLPNPAFERTAPGKPASAAQGAR